ncbi:MAG: sigma-70 family RNA polymerase sigma factor [Myxococcota bacterium]
MPEAPTTDDFELLLRWRSGDRSAGDALLRRHFRSLYAFFANKTGGPVDDLIQESFKACVEGRDRIREGASFRAYLLAVARNQLYRHYARHEAVEFDPEKTSVAQLTTSPSVLIANAQSQRYLLAALRAIPLELQIVIELSYWEELSARELGEALEVPEGTAKSRLRRARQALLEQFHAIYGAADLSTHTIDDLDRWAMSIREELAVRNVRRQSSP